MDNSETIIETRQGTIKVVQYNKPKKKNAIDVNMYLRITKILNDAANDADISVMVLTGTGDYYSSGNDLSAPRDSTEGPFLDILKKFIDAFITFPKTLVAIVNGPAVGVAATTLALCDLVFASENAFFYTPFTKLGLVAEGCSTFTFPRLIGDRKAAAMLMYNQKMSAKEALDCGFINYMYKPEELQSKVWDKIMEVSQFPQESITVTKNLMRRNLKDTLTKTNEMEMDELHKIWIAKTNSKL
ncbi:enoyl-CoA delta isomerase 2 [Pectinophora gossypiella]|uniref:enoyl-CoA delta isomerase 2 n=1 Tax=Pectinophora gossypiella TaxID=13191 RepID=UPI00214E3B69|nr:enoyl-CoA delta isomerase 2 [Pectinophora gossypiella]